MLYMNFSLSCAAAVYYLSKAAHTPDELISVSLKRYSAFSKSLVPHPKKIHKK